MPISGYLGGYSNKNYYQVHEKGQRDIIQGQQVTISDLTEEIRQQQNLVPTYPMHSHRKTQEKQRIENMRVQRMSDLAKTC